MSGKRWTAGEIEILERLYGRVDAQTICRKLNISYSRFRSKCKALGLGYQREADESITSHQLSEIMGISDYAIKRFIKKGLPVKEMQFGTGRKNLMFNMNKLMAWLKNNQTQFNALKIEYMALGLEPQWLKDKRKSDFDANQRAKLATYRCILCGKSIDSPTKQQKRRLRESGGKRIYCSTECAKLYVGRLNSSHMKDKRKKVIRKAQGLSSIRN
jgi:hypothetical protein